MAAPKGNKFGEGNSNAGVSKHYDREEYAAKLLEWVKKPSSIGVAGFCAQELIPIEYLSRWSKDSEAFRQALDIAKAVICDRQEFYIQSNRFDFRMHNRQMGYYNAAIREFDREEKAYEYGLKKDVEDKATSITIKPINYSKAVDG